MLFRYLYPAFNTILPYSALLERQFKVDFNCGNVVHERTLHRSASTITRQNFGLTNMPNRFRCPSFGRLRLCFILLWPHNIPLTDGRDSRHHTNNIVWECPSTILVSLIAFLWLREVPASFPTIDSSGLYIAVSIHRDGSNSIALFEFGTGALAANVGGSYGRCTHLQFLAEGTKTWE
jgi:hypothetical protein